MIEIVAWTLLHFFWQGAAIASGTALLLHTWHHADPRLRYRIAGLGLLAMALAPVATALVLTLSGRATPLPPGVPELVAGTTGALPWTWALVAAWSIGVGVGLGRNLLGLLHLTWLCRRAIAAPPALEATFRELCARLGVPGVRLRLMRRGLSPLAVGWLRPTVLLPASLLLRLPSDQIEALLVHELVHVRRLDWLTNLAQALVESLLFYHPAVHWLSAIVRHERELCCDAVAVHTLRDPIAYARALTELHAVSTLTLAPAARGGVLMDRILRLVGRPTPAQRPMWVLPTLLASTLIGLATAAAAVASDPELPGPGDDGVAAVVSEEDEDEADRTQPEDVGARALEMLADQLEKGAEKLDQSADKLEAKADERQERKAAKKADKADKRAPQQAGVRVRVHHHDHDGAHGDPGVAELTEEVQRLRAEVRRLRGDPGVVAGRGGDGGCTELVAGDARMVVCGGDGGDGVVVLDGDERVVIRGDRSAWSARSGAWAAHAQALAEEAEARALGQALRAEERAMRQAERAQERALEQYERAVEQRHGFDEQAMERWAEDWEDWAADFSEGFEDFEVFSDGNVVVVPPIPPLPPAPGVAPLAPAPPAPPARVRRSDR